MNKKNSGFAAIGGLLLLVAVVIIGLGGYTVMKKNNKKSNVGSSISAVKKTAETAPIKADGTAATAAKAVSTQVTNEIKVEDDGFEAEDAATNSVNTAQVDKIGGSADASKF